MFPREEEVPAGEVRGRPLLFAVSVEEGWGLIVEVGPTEPIGDVGMDKRLPRRQDALAALIAKTSRSSAAAASVAAASGATSGVSRL